MLVLDMLQPPFDICKLIVPACLAVLALQALVLAVERRQTEPPLVESEHRDTARGVLRVYVLVPGDVLRETMHEEHDGLRERRGVGACVELVAVEAGQPLLDELGRH